MKSQENILIPRLSLGLHDNFNIIDENTPQYHELEEPILQIQAPEEEESFYNSKFPKFKFSKKLLLQGPEGASHTPVKQVSSQGCSKVYIVKVLITISDFIKLKVNNHMPSIFTFKRDLVLKWLNDAKIACCSDTYKAEEEYYGGPIFIFDDASTHWTEPHQLYTWWKNNIERRSKFKVLTSDAHYTGNDPRKSARYGYLFESYYVKS